MKLELHDLEDKFIKPLENMNATLAEAGIKDDMVIFVQDIHGNNAAPEDDVPHFVISDEKYDQREGCYIYKSLTVFVYIIFDFRFSKKVEGKHP